MRFKLTIEYDGTNLCGWQKQNNQDSVQVRLEKAIFELTKEKVETIASGRTDAGVHALGQVVHFDLPTNIALNFDEYKLRKGINHFLKNQQVSVISIEKVNEDFHARFSAKKRFYRYIILNRPSPPVIDQNRVWHVANKLDLENIIKGAKYFEGKHDFTSFRASECQAQNPVKTIDEIKISKDGDRLYIDVSALSFLHHMIRNISGTLKEVGEGKRNPEDIKKIIEAKNRSEAGMTAPACGLYFVKVAY